jgi:hypothetical protein
LDRAYLNNIRKHAGPFTIDREEFDTADETQLQAKVDYHERMKILFATLSNVPHTIADFNYQGHVSSTYPISFDMSSDRFEVVLEVWDARY